MSTQETERSGGGSFLDLDVDFRTDDWTPRERDLMLAWYEANHEEGDSQLSRFAEFTIEHNPGGFKRYRRFIATIDTEIDGTALPQGAHLLGFLYSYILLGYEKGIVYCAINLRRLGHTRGEVADVVRLATPAAGPLGLNAAAELLGPYLRDWPQDEDVPGIAWPAGWAADPDAARAGLDRSTDELLAGELEVLEDWNRRTYGEVPAQVLLLARLHPSAFKTQRLAFEGSFGEHLPAQMATLCLLMYDAWRGRTRPIRRSAQLARALGVGRTHVVATLFWAAVYGGESVLEPAIDAIGDLLADWPAAP